MHHAGAVLAQKLLCAGEAGRYQQGAVPHPREACRGLSGGGVDIMPRIDTHHTLLSSRRRLRGHLEAKPSCMCLEAVRSYGLLQATQAVWQHPRFLMVSVVMLEGRGVQEGEYNDVCHWLACKASIDRGLLGQQLRATRALSGRK